MYILHFVYPFDCKWTYVLLPLLAIVNSVGINMSIQIFLHGPAFYFFFFLYLEIRFLDHVVILFSIF